MCVRIEGFWAAGEVREASGSYQKVEWGDPVVLAELGQADAYRRLEGIVGLAPLKKRGPPTCEALI